MIEYMKLSTLLCAIFLLSSIFRVSPVLAQTNQGLTISPAYQEIVFEQNDVEKSSSFHLTNSTNQPVELEFQVIPYTVADYVGSLSFYNPTLNESLGGVNYVNFASNQVVIDPGKTVETQFVVENRASLSPGGHYVAIVSRMKQSTNLDVDQQQIVPAVSSLLLIRKKDGEQVNLSLKEVDMIQKSIFSALPKRMQLTFENQGNVHVIPRGEMKMSDSFGRIVGQASVNENSSYVMPGTRRVMPLAVHSAQSILPISFLTVEILGYAQGHEARFSYQSSYFYISPIFVGAILLVILLMIVIWKKLKRKNIDQ